jgi:hypothetical protein
VKLLGRVVIVPAKVLVVSVQTAFRAGRVVGSVPVGMARGTRRVLGLRGTLALVVGFAVGLLLAPVPGRQLRARLATMLARRGGLTDTDLADRVRFELEHAPRTWHLPQPRVAVAGGRVVLSGEIDHAEARTELARVAAAVPGVTAVDNLVAVPEPGEAGVGGEADPA